MSRPRLLKCDGAACAESAFLSELRPGCRVGVYYPDDSLWHERMLLYPVRASKGEWYVLTPDSDVYIENVIGGDAEGSTRSFLCGPLRERPAIAAGKFYRFREWPGTQALRRYVVDCRALVSGSEHEVTDPNKVITPSDQELDFYKFIGLPRPAERGPEAATPDRGAVGGAQLVSLATPPRRGHDHGRAGGPRVSFRGEQEAEEVETADTQWLAMESAFGIEMRTAVTTTEESASRKPRSSHSGREPGEEGARREGEREGRRGQGRAQRRPP